MPPTLFFCEIIPSIRVPPFPPPPCTTALTFPGVPRPSGLTATTVSIRYIAASSVVMPPTLFTLLSESPLPRRSSSLAADDFFPITSFLSATSSGFVPALSFSDPFRRSLLHRPRAPTVSTVCHRGPPSLSINCIVSSLANSFRSLYRCVFAFDCLAIFVLFFGFLAFSALCLLSCLPGLWLSLPISHCLLLSEPFSFRYPSSLVLQVVAFNRQAFVQLPRNPNAVKSTSQHCFSWFPVVLFLRFGQVRYHKPRQWFSTKIVNPRGKREKREENA
ncbi:hypothetical protein C8R44DRAFT_301247 [Mycena epipterygia]|nr:hypothetical protein C8R44DRAFT_301247 [Mycena epipterygia]